MSLEIPLISGFTRLSLCKIMRIIIIVSISALRHTPDRFENQRKVYTASGAAPQQQGNHAAPATAAEQNWQTTP